MLAVKIGYVIWHLFNCYGSVCWLAPSVSLGACTLTYVRQLSRYRSAACSVSYCCGQFCCLVCLSVSCITLVCTDVTWLSGYYHLWTTHGGCYRGDQLVPSIHPHNDWRPPCLGMTYMYYCRCVCCEKWQWLKHWAHETYTAASNGLGLIIVSLHFLCRKNFLIRNGIIITFRTILKILFVVWNPLLGLESNLSCTVYVSLCLV